ncbi:tripartite tricarboxylate transporter substrate binding protein [Kribbella sandramycini]|uniref:Tripartite tricarboxylate transporter substrate binding protein n=1 Tax=Kribbella sandramycini TaxID=60450 RepID=A0A7Y4P3C3_9ACTN|nr:tripartite tricarboxylate transporter substrate binding protein [Kribbella sandramycini]MBB6570824.1 tripartite-type tricarboxylate transporter receptor subunit TctC [Kribbella sandramycini]NOL43955.1 tripartite tricarboxylate transporter substrate binding protein [Kribbella sandramycini]
MKLNRHAVLIAAAVVSLTGCGGVKTTATGGAGEYPTGNIQMSVGNAPGGSTDLITRALAEGIGRELGVAVPVVNKPGANGALNAKELAAAKPDGYQIAVQNASLFTITPLAVSGAEAVSIDDFELIGGISQDDFVLLAPAASGAKTIADLRKGGKSLKYGTTGVGTGAQLASALTFEQAGIPAADVPFDGGAPALTALLGSQIDVATIQVGDSIAQIKAKKVVPLAVFSDARIKFLPDVATAKEQGFDVVVSQYRFLTAPKGTPDAVKTKLADAAKKTFATDAYQQFNDNHCLTPIEVTPGEVHKILDQYATKYKAQIDQYKLTLGANK